tara:strand:+ start:2137 stop:2766 length:630 start_codon:yes stop_codon:yes gene_type:complete
MGLEVIAIASIISTVASAGVSYVGAQRQAKAQEYQADAAIAQAEVNSKIAYQKRQAAAQDANYQAGVADYNKNATVAEFGREELAFNNEVEEKQASFINNAFSTQGSFEDIFNAEETSFNLASANLSSKYSEKSFQLNEQADLARAGASRSLSLGRYESANVLQGGQNAAVGFRNQASASRTAGIGALIGGIGSAAGQTAGYVNDETLS